MSVVRRLLRTFARGGQGRGLRHGVRIQCFRGCGSAEMALVIGRVTREPALGLGERSDPLKRDVKGLFRRFLRRGVGGAVVRARMGDAQAEVHTDRDGYFEVRLPLRLPPDADAQWRAMEITLGDAKRPPVAETAGVLFPRPKSEFLVISDIDDTVMQTGVANKAIMMWRLFAEGARSRVAFPGVAAFYRALHDGAAGDMGNPMIYVSRAPWSIYDVLEAFFKEHRIPSGPVLFLREWGATLQSPMPRRAKQHKQQLIAKVLELYPDLPAVLIGDSGQRDPEIYRQVVQEHPDRVRAVYIRDVSADEGRSREISSMLAELAKANVSAVIADNTLDMAIHASAQGLIAAERLQELDAKLGAAAAAD